MTMKKYFHFWQYQGLEGRVGEDTIDTMNETDKWNTHQAMVLTRNGDSELYELRSAISLF